MVYETYVARLPCGSVRAELALQGKRRELHLIPARGPSHNRAGKQPPLRTTMSKRKGKLRE